MLPPDWGVVKSLCHRNPGGQLPRRLVLWLAATVCASAFGQVFTEIPLPIPGLRYGSVAWGDFNNDGLLDLLVCGSSTNGPVTRVYRNNGGGVFTDIGAGLPGISTGVAVWGDYNGDSFLDIALTGMSASGRITRIYRNNGNGGFTNIGASLPGLDNSIALWGDFDNDGDLDLFLSGSNGSSYVGAMYRNDGTNGFADAGITTIKGGASASAAFADFDGDGKLDLLFAGYTGDTSSGQSTRLYRNTGANFTNITGINLTAMNYCSVAWGDYDNDGRLDLLMAGYGSS